jgi:glutaminyl-peptide cyclotransferase
VLFGAVALGAIALACSGGGEAPAAAASTAQPPAAAARPTPSRAERLVVEVVARYPHDPGAFTQGLLLKNGLLYESTGLEGKSSVREVEVQTGAVKRRLDLSPTIFGEGLADVDGRLVQLTWKNQTAFVYDLATFKQTGKFSYGGEGWGLCYDGASLIMSDGSDRLYFRDPRTFIIVREVPVTLDGAPQANLNELECVGDDVYANVWTMDTIVRIEKRTGLVRAVIDAPGLLTADERQGVDVMNGIAYDASDRTFLITGKLWPVLFRVRFAPAR